MDQIIVLIVLFAIAIILMAMLVYKRHEKRSAYPKSEVNALLLAELDELYKLRTGLSTELINVALDSEVNENYPESVHKFLQQIVDSLRRIMRSIHHEDCAVSIKMFIPGGSDGITPLIQTMYRDGESSRRRKETYESLEPYKISDHSEMSKIMNSRPLIRFSIHDGNEASAAEYVNPNSEWEKLFNASAIHIISDPNSVSEDAFFGFLCVDSVQGGFDSEVVRYIMSILSTKIFYCIYASAALEQVTDENSRGKPTELSKQEV